MGAPKLEGSKEAHAQQKRPVVATPDFIIIAEGFCGPPLIIELPLGQTLKEANAQIDGVRRMGLKVYTAIIAFLIVVSVFV